MPSENTVDTARERRADLLERATHFSRMEGLETTAEFKSDAHAYVDGTIDLDQLGRHPRARYSQP